MLAFGHAGVPVVLFPTSQGRYYEYKDFRLIEAAAPLVDAGRWWDMFPRYLAKL
jgi:esterase/lipase superfamily enzyme